MIIIIIIIVVVVVVVVIISGGSSSTHKLFIIQIFPCIFPLQSQVAVHWNSPLSIRRS